MQGSPGTPWAGRPSRHQRVFRCVNAYERLMEEVRQLLGRPVDVCLMQLLKREISASALTDPVAL